MEQTKRVLVIEDDVIYQETLARFADGLVELTFAETLEDARKILDQEELPDHALVDYRLPDGLGSELVPILREKKIPAILMSFLSPQALKSQTKADSYCEIISKEQIDKEKLLELLDLSE